MSTFEEPRVTFSEQQAGRTVTVRLNGPLYPNVLVAFSDETNPDETNSQERTRVLARAKQLLQEAADSL